LYSMSIEAICLVPGRCKTMMKERLLSKFHSATAPRRWWDLLSPCWRWKQTRRLQWKQDFSSQQCPLLYQSNTVPPFGN
jgi:hypothetical protein